MSATARPGQPDGGKWWHPLAYLGGLFGAAALAWAMLAGVAWFVWAYTLVAGSIVLVLAGVVLAAHLACKRGWRPKLAAAVLFAALMVFVSWVIPR